MVSRRQELLSNSCDNLDNICEHCHKNGKNALAISTEHSRMAFSFQDCKKVIVQVFMAVELYSHYMTKRDIKFYRERLEKMMRIP